VAGLAIFVLKRSSAWIELALVLLYAAAMVRTITTYRRRRHHPPGQPR
jgi:hypothetical protein